MMLVVSLVLDPRYKVKYASFCFTKAYPNNSENVQKLNALVIKVMKMLFDYYKKIDSSSHCVITCLQYSLEMKFDQPIGNYLKDMGTINDEWKAQQSRHLEEYESLECQSKLDQYLEESCEKVGSNFDILSWWKTNSNKF